MILRENSSEQKLRGAYYTPLPLAEKMIGLFRDDPDIRSVLEPSCGDGVFVDGLIRTGAIEQVETVTAVEIDEAEALKVSEKVTSKLSSKTQNQEKVTVLNQDFFEFYQENKETRYDLILGNPPYIRYQYLSEEQRESMSAILTSHGMKSNKLVNTWVGFLVACVQMLSDHGRIVFVIPAEIMQVAYAQDLRLFLADSLSRITLITFEELVFPDIEQEIVVFIGEKGGAEKGIRIIELSNLSDLEDLDLEDNEFQKMQHVHEKWTKYFTDKKENELIRDIRSHEKFRKLSEIAVINVGITTGNNKYFSVDQKTVDQFSLEETVRPLIGRSSHAHSVYFAEEDWKKNVEAGKAAYLIDFPDIPYKDYPKKYKKYIRQGEKAGEHTGYKCSIRERWYRIPSIWVPDAFFLRRNNLYPKFVLNCCDAVSTDTMHRIKFREGIEPERIALSYYNSISFAFTEICGRSYGGGVLEILPGEVGEIMVPNLDQLPIETVRETLKQVDQIIRRDEDIELALDLVDKKILVDEIGVSGETCENARKIWKKLQRRRLKRS